MAKYDYEFKKKIVNAYMNGEGGKKFLANKYGVKSSQDVMKWVNDFKIAGPDALRPNERGDVPKCLSQRKTNLQILKLLAIIQII